MPASSALNNCFLRKKVKHASQHGERANYESNHGWFSASFIFFAKPCSFVMTSIIFLKSPLTTVHYSVHTDPFHFFWFIVQGGSWFDDDCHTFFFPPLNQYL